MHSKKSPLAGSLVVSLLLNVALCLVTASEAKCPLGGCVGPITYYFGSDNCDPRTVKDVAQVMDTRVAAAGPNSCYDNTYAGKGFVQWSCGAECVSSTFGSISCSGTPLNSRTIVSKTCLNTSSTVTGTRGSQMVMCSSQEKIPTPSGYRQMPTSGPVFSNDPVSCAAWESCASLAAIQTYYDAECKSPGFVFPETPAKTTTGAALKSGVCYQQSPLATSRSNVMYKCTPTSYSVYNYINGCDGEPFSEFTAQVGVCIQNSPGQWIKYFCRG
jgi:hypothetical protein